MRKLTPLYLVSPAIREFALTLVGSAAPYLIGQMIDISGTPTFPWMIVGLAVIALVAFARANTVLGG
ncbi:MAG TPA: hypothetical protein DCY63_01400 [Acidimicrobiaceae bacterium]|nr:hypothetical protein [Actinomycetota bacterium]HAZ32475.1 hypothetical protein [Acidimicrobiaceae bacterium]